MDGWVFARLAAVVIVAVAITATAIHFVRDDQSTGPQSSLAATAAETPRPDPLRETLRRCRQLGEVATRDAECLAAWDENRRRFLSPSAGN